jgi:hypothetical protein
MKPGMTHDEFLELGRLLKDETNRASSLLCDLSARFANGSRAVKAASRLVNAFTELRAALEDAALVQHNDRDLALAVYRGRL